MNKYQEISQRLGYEKRDLILPTKSEALRLYREIEETESEEAFERIFEYYRFVKDTGITEEEHEVGRIIVYAFRIGESIFSKEAALTEAVN